MVGFMGKPYVQTTNIRYPPYSEYPVDAGFLANGTYPVGGGYPLNDGYLADGRWQESNFEHT